MPGREPILFGSGYALRRGGILIGWLLLPALLSVGVRLHNPVHFVTALILGAALWPVTTRSGEVRWDGLTLSVRRYFRFVPLSARDVDAAVVTPPFLRRQSLVLKLRRRLCLSRYVYCRLRPESVCAAWALIHERAWEPR